MIQYTETWKAKHRNSSDAMIQYALDDINDTLRTWRDEPETDYTRKLWSEWDYLVVLKQKRG